MNEVDHILLIATRSKSEIARDRAHVTALRNRNEAIRAALEDGVSDRAVAIAAGLNRTMVWQINTRGEDRPRIVAEEVITDVHAVNAIYPCCKRQARFGTSDADHPTVFRQCRECRVEWVVNRSTIVETARGRVDYLKWSTNIAA